MNVEWHILILCSRVTLTEPEQIRLQELSQSNVEWRELLHLALFHRTLALVYRKLRTYCPDALPDPFITTAKDHLHRQGARNLMMSATLMRVLVSFEKRGLQAVPFKGPVFTQTVFGDLALRTYGDLDILVSEDDLPEAVEVIKAEGFTPFFPLTKSQLEALAKTDNEYQLHQPMNDIVIDLQWELAGGYSPYPLYLSTLFPNLRVTDFLAKSVVAFGQEDLLVYLCIHGNQHVWEQLDQVCCVAETVRSSHDLDWNLVRERAEELRVGRMVRIGLLLASTLLAAELPANVISAIKMDRQAVILAEERAGDLAQPLSVKARGLTSRRFVLYHLKSLDSPLQAIRYGCHIFFVPTRYDWQKLSLPAWMSPLHYIYRPLRLIWAGINTLLQNFSGKEK